MVRREAGAGEEVLEELASHRRTEEDGGLWRNLRLDWVRNWDQSCQTAVLLSRLQHTGRLQQPSDHLNRTRTKMVPEGLNGFCLFGRFHSLLKEFSLFSSLELTSCDSAVLWRYLTALHDQRRVVDWIQNEETSSGSRWPELTPELVNNNTVCSTYMRERILDLLARYSSTPSPL